MWRCLAKVLHTLSAYGIRTNTELQTRFDRGYIKHRSGRTHNNHRTRSHHCTSQILRNMSTTTTATTESTLISAPSDSAEQLISQLDGTHTLPLWAQMAKLNPAEPNPRCTPHVWRYGEMRPYLLRAGSLITEKQAERRVLMLVSVLIR
jgi:hypothetical protein